MELEIPAANPRTFSDVMRNDQHMLKLETVLMTIYYPSAFGSGSGKDPGGHKNWSRQTWLPRPRASMAHGYGKFGGVGALAVPFFAATTMFTKLPAFRNAPLAQHWPPHENLYTAGPKVKNTRGPPPEGAAEEPQFPLMLFSHGLGGTRTMYSSLCGEFASYGFVVVAVEHRDCSGPRTIVNHTHADGPEGENAEGTMHEREKKAGDDMKHNAKQKKKGYDTLDYLFPEDNPRDTDPRNEKGVDEHLRNAQIDLRCAELEEAYAVVTAICNGKGEYIAKRNLRRKGYKGSSSHGLDGVDWSSWTNRIHLKRVTMMGHSFGSATTVEVLRLHPARFSYVSQGIILDVWGAGMKKPDDDPKHKIKLPILCINSEAFSYWKSNFDLVKSLAEEAQGEDALAWLMTLRGTIHVSYSDIALLYPHICSLLLKCTADPQRTIDLTISACLDFLALTMPAGATASQLITRTIRSVGVLETDAIHDWHDIPDEELHKPHKDMWIAARLQIPHELRYRFDPRLAIQRKKARKKRKDGGLVGMGEPWRELWMHVAPDQELRDKHKDRLPNKRGSGEEEEKGKSKDTDGNEQEGSMQDDDDACGTTHPKSAAR